MEIKIINKLIFTKIMLSLFLLLLCQFTQPVTTLKNIRFCRQYKPMCSRIDRQTKNVDQNFNFAEELKKEIATNLITRRNLENIITHISKKATKVLTTEGKQQIDSTESKKQIFLRVTSEGENLLLVIITANIDVKKKFKFINTLLKTLLAKSNQIAFHEQEKKDFLNATLNSSGNTALMFAFEMILSTNKQQEYANIAKLLIQSGADVIKSNRDNETTFKKIVAIQQEDIRNDLFDWLLKALKNNLEKELCIAGEMREKIKNIVQNNYQSDRVRRFLHPETTNNGDNNYRETALGKSIMDGQTYIPIATIEFINNACRKKVNIKLYHIAISSANEPVIEKLEEEGVMKKHGNAKGQKGRGLLKIIIRHCEGSVDHTPGAKHNSIETSKQLVDKALNNFGANLTSHDQWNMTSPHTTILKGNIPLTEAFIKYGKTDNIIIALTKTCIHKHNIQKHKIEEQNCECCNYVAKKTPLDMLKPGVIRGGHRGRGRNIRYNTQRAANNYTININREMLPIIIQDEEIKNNLQDNYNDLFTRISNNIQIPPREIRTIVAPLVVNKMRKIILETENKESGKTLEQLFLGGDEYQTPKRKVKKKISQIKKTLQNFND